MKFALLGVDDDALGLVKSVVSSGRHRLSVAVATELQLEQVRGIEPRVTTDWTWETLIAAPEIDAVIVARSEDQDLHDEQLRKLGQAGISLVVSHPSCSAIFAYELEMICSDVGGILIPLFPARSHPAVKTLQQWVAEGSNGPLGVINRLDIERYLPRQDAHSFTHFLALDAYMASSLVGPVTSVSAVGVAVAENVRYDDVTVHMSGEGPLLARWSTIPSPGARVRLIGTSGEATLQMNGDPTAWTLRCSAQNCPEQTFTTWDQSASILEDLQQSDSEQDSGVTWQDVCRHLEIVETAKTSLQRKRTLDVFSEPRTVEDSFKGVMAVGSCALLLFIVFALAFLAVFEGFRLQLVDPVELTSQADDSDRWPLVLRLWPVYPLLAFLALQLLLMVARKR